MKTIGIFGTSGFAREVDDIAHELGFRTLFIAREQAELDAVHLPGDAILESELGAQHGIAQFAIGIGENAVRQRIAQRYSELEFINLIHPTASFGRGQHEAIEKQRGVIVCAGVRFTNHIQVGSFTIFNLNATVGHDSRVDDFANLAPGAHISGNVHIGARCWIGTGAAINQGKEGNKLLIGADTVVGSGAVVVKDCEPNGVYVGAPAKRIK